VKYGKAVAAEFRMRVRRPGAVRRRPRRDFRVQAWRWCVGGTTPVPVREFFIRRGSGRLRVRGF